MTRKVQHSFAFAVTIASSVLLATQVAYATPRQDPDDPIIQDPNDPIIATGEADRVSLNTGRSTTIRTTWRVARVSITDPSVADVQVLSPNLMLLTAANIGHTDLIVWGEGDEVWRAHVTVNVDLTYLRAELEAVFPDAALHVMQTEDIIVVGGTLRRVEHARQLAELLEAYGIKFVDRTRIAGVHQVLLRVRIAEASREAIRSLGVNAVYGNDDFFGATQVGSDSGGPLNPVPIFPASGSSAAGNIPFIFGDVAIASGVTLLAGLPDSDLQLFIEALAENQYVRILAEPSLIALSGEKASFLAGGEFPIPVVQGAGAGGGSSVTIEYKEFGVQLRFVPTVLGDGTIRLYVAPEVSELSEFGAIRIEGFSIPSVLTRRAETTLELKSGQTFAIAGLLRSTTTARRSQVPLLGDLPVIGPLFRSVRYVNGETELLILVTASLVEPMSEAALLPTPGSLHVTPNDWEFYVEGRIEGVNAAPISAPEAAWLKELGLARLRGPGAWASHEQRPVLPAPVRSEPAEETPEPQGE